jgi:hypothetical protein
VVCVAAGNYNVSSTIYPSHSGTSSNWITYTAYNGVPVITWTGGGSTAVIQSYGSTFPNGPGYIIVQGLSFNGNNQADQGYSCNGAAHLKFLYNTFVNFGSAGIESVKCDYITADHNTVLHSGYNQGWSSGIDFGLLDSFDSYSGFHNFMTNNIVAGEFDGSSYHSDGNGFIIDDGGQGTTNNPATLVANNVAYANGGRGFACDDCSNAWFVNNTSYGDGLDTSQSGIEWTINDGYSVHWVNNIAESWNNNRVYIAEGTTSNLSFTNNLYFGGSNSVSGATGFINANPNFINPTSVTSTALTAGTGGQYANAINPSSLGNALDLQSNSPAIGAGIDPTTLTSDSNLKSDMSSHIYTDMNGNTRPVGGPFTLGAYAK